MTGLLPTQAPSLLQESDWVHLLLSSHCAPVCLFALTQPTAGLQVSTTQPFLLSQTTSAPLPQTPAVQTSPVRHLFAVLQGVVLGRSS